MRGRNAVVRRAVCSTALVVGCLGTGWIGGAQQQSVSPDPSAPATRVPATPDAVAQARRQRTRSAEQRTLFSSSDPLAFTLMADFKAVNRDRNPESTRTFPATLVVQGPSGEQRLGVRIRTRGHARRNIATCTFAPLRIEFPPGTAAGTVFDGHKTLKLGVHCRDVDLYEQYVYREYLAYRIYNLISPRSLRARLATATYVDAESGKRLTSRAGLFLEDDDDVARRLDGEVTELKGMGFAHVDRETMTVVSLFEYMIGNTDVSLYALHNLVLVRASTSVVYPVPYDFDYSGLVNARYAIPSKEFGLSTVRERLYRGPCRTPGELAPLLTRMGAAREAIMQLYDALPALDDGYRKDAKGYLAQFFRVIDRPDDVKRTFVDNCANKSTM